MNIAILAFTSLLLLAPAASAEAKHWRKLLAEPVNEEWQQIFGTALFQKHARPAETIASKMHAVQELIANSNKARRTIPVFLPPKLALTHCKPIRASVGIRTGMPISRVPAGEMFRFIANLNDWVVVETEHGILFRSR